MNFNEAIQKLIYDKKKIRRQTWSKRALGRVWYELTPTGIDFKGYIKFLGIKKEKLRVLQHYSDYTPIFSLDDIQANDWEEYND